VIYQLTAAFRETALRNPRPYPRWRQGSVHTDAPCYQRTGRSALSTGCGRVGRLGGVPAARGRHPDPLRSRRSRSDGVHHQHWDHRL